MLAQTPPLGWNSWNTFGGEIHEDLIRETADAFVREGLKDAGYEYVVIDDLWEADARVDGWKRNASGSPSAPARRSAPRRPPSSIEEIVRKDRIYG